MYVSDNAAFLKQLFCGIPTRNSPPDGKAGKIINFSSTKNTNIRKSPYWERGLIAASFTMGVTPKILSLRYM